MDQTRPITDGQPSISLLVIQPTPFCNLDCDYCYLPDRSSTRKITQTTLERIFTQVFESGLVGPHVTVVWHAGEPMVMPVTFYRDAFHLATRLQPEGILLEHSFQTNGVLINQSWCDFIKESGLRIGVSVDGPQFLHDAHRKTRSGKGTYTRVMNGIQTLQDNGVEFHVITVLTRNSLQYPDELFDFYVGNAIRQIAFNIEEIEGVNQTSTLAAKGVYEKFVRFISRFFDLVKESNGTLSVREFDTAIATICTPDDHPVYNHQVEPFGIVTVDCEGNISTFSPELVGQRSEDYGDFTFGNVHTDTLTSIQSNPKFQKLNREIREGVNHCQQSCQYFSVCGGGAPANKFYENGSFESTETLFCRLTKKAVFDLILSDMHHTLGTVDRPTTRHPIPNGKRSGSRTSGQARRTTIET